MREYYPSILSDTQSGQYAKVPKPHPRRPSMLYKSWRGANAAVVALKDLVPCRPQDMSLTLRPQTRYALRPGGTRTTTPARPF